MTDPLLEYCYKHEKEYVYDTGQREFDCLIELVKDGTISTFEQLSEYIDY
jgi:hypothetical protein